jgi:ABC-type antimicrobial peptide transport system permease subunit
VALALAGTGIFGVMSYAVAQRSREISIRMALGARAGEVMRMIMGRALALAAGGLVAGVAAALALGRIIQGQLFGVTLFDPLTLTGVVLALGASAAAASFLPAWRAARLDPEPRCAAADFPFPFWRATLP